MGLVRIACSVIALNMLACEREVERPGQLIVTIDTDMALPEQADQLHVRVEVEGRVQFEQPFDLGPRTIATLPATLNIVSYSDSPDPVTVKIAGSKATREGLSWRTYREATMQVPTDRIARLRMPVQWLCKGQAEAESMDDSPLEQPRAKSTCDKGYTCRAGHCEKSEIDARDLPDYSPETVFGGGATPDAGSCFDTIGCMAQGRTVEPDADCRIPKPEAKKFNVGLRVLDDGICDEGQLNCYVPLDGEDPEGWEVAGDQLQLPPAVCEKLTDGQVRAVLVADACEPKTASVPTCGPWSKVPKGEEGVYRPRGDVMAGATVLTRLPTQTDADRCCPLMAAGDKLFACVCTGASNGTVFAIDPAQPAESSTVGTLNPSSPRKEPLAAGVFEGSLYWTAGREVRRTPLAGSTALASGFGVPAPAALYETGSLLIDQTNIYALASGGSGVGTASVELFAIPRDGSNPPAAVPMGNAPVYQFDHDADAVYLALDQDQPMDPLLRRTSSVVRVDKRTGVRSTLLPERTLTLPNKTRGGYIGVLAENGTLYALFEDVADGGGLRAKLEAFPLDASQKQPTTLYELPIDPARTRLRLLGIADGQVLLSRLELSGAAIVSATILVVAAEGGNPRLIADFVRDFPVDGFGVDEDSVYWLNASGALYTLPRSVLR